MSVDVQWLKDKADKSHTNTHVSQLFVCLAQAVPRMPTVISRYRHAKLLKPFLVNISNFLSNLDVKTRYIKAKLQIFSVLQSLEKKH